MYKNKLQELCQKSSFPLPSYETTREGPQHSPRFETTVTVNSLTFTSFTPSRTVKLSQNDAAMIAYHHFDNLQNPCGTPFLRDLHLFPQPMLSASPDSSLSQGSPIHNPDVESTLPTDIIMQPYSAPASQTSQISIPVATVADVTSSLVVTVADVTSSPVVTVADVTSSPVVTVAEVMKAQDMKSVMHLYKNQLQKYAQKKNLDLPKYASEWEGPPHAMCFRCKVTIDGQTFETCKLYSTLKDAEHAAAEIALKSLQPTGVQEDDIVIYKNLLQELTQKEGFHMPIYSTSKFGEAHKPTFTSQVEIDGKVFCGQESKSKKQAEMNAAKVAYTTLTECKVEENLSSSGNMNGCSRVTFPSKSKAIPSFSDSNHVEFETNNVSSTAGSTSSLRKKVIVYAIERDVEMEDGGTSLPISNDKWIASSYSH